MVTDVDTREIAERIQAALVSAVEALQGFTSGSIAAELKSGGDPVTEADLAVNRVLHQMLPRGDEGWLSEETADDASRLTKEALWIVDPLDGTREFVSGIPEWCVSIAYVRRGRAIAGGIVNPATRETFLGVVGDGLKYQGRSVSQNPRSALNGARVLASHSEVKRGEWKRFDNAPFTIVPMGSVAYKLARVSAGLDDITWTLTPKHEWDVAAGVALVEAAGGYVRTLDGNRPEFNRRELLLSGLIASGAKLENELTQFLRPYLPTAQ